MAAADAEVLLEEMRRHHQSGRQAIAGVPTGERE